MEFVFRDLDDSSVELQDMRTHRDHGEACIQCIEHCDPLFTVLILETPLLFPLGYCCCIHKMHLMTFSIPLVSSIFGSFLASVNHPYGNSSRPPPNDFSAN